MGAASMIEAHQLKGWTNLPTAQVCWVINDYESEVRNQFYTKLLDKPKLAVKQIKEIALNIGVKIEDVDIPQVLEVFTGGANTWHKWGRRP